jgi:Transcription factor WhiB
LPTRAKPFRCGIHGRGIDRLRRQEKANGVCAQCPVAVDCGEHALGFVENFGTWSGLSEEERDNLVESTTSPQTLKFAGSALHR